MKRLAITFCLTISLAIGSFGVGWSGDFQKGADAYEKGDYATAFREWKPLADQGDASAQHNLGVMYDEGYGVLQDHKAAVKWYTLAAEQGLDYAQFNLGWMYYNGENVNKDVFKAFELYKMATDFGHPRAMFNLANMHFSGTGTVKDLKMAYKLFLKSRMNGVKESDYFIEEITNQLKPEELNLLNSEFESLIEKKIVMPVTNNQ